MQSCWMRVVEFSVFFVNSPVHEKLKNKNKTEHGFFFIFNKQHRNCNFPSPTNGKLSTQLNSTSCCPLLSVVLVLALYNTRCVIET